VTPDQVKAKFAESGTPVSEWADQNNFPRDAVYRVLNGYTPCKRGQSYAIAVKLGLKPKPKALSL
jgi:gp16 family phage-associated protein